MNVLVYGDASVTVSILRRARLVTARVFEHGGVRIVWFDAYSERCVEAHDAGSARQAFLRSLYTLRVEDGSKIDRRGVSPGSALGFTAPSTRVATALYRRVEQTARESGQDPALVLGHVIAHELGHLLLRRSSHSSAGLMQATLDVKLAAQGRLRFTEDQAAAIRAALPGGDDPAMCAVSDSS